VSSASGPFEAMVRPARTAAAAWSPGAAPAAAAGAFSQVRGKPAFTSRSRCESDEPIAATR
jgi:hypothetical protein